MVLVAVTGFRFSLHGLGLRISELSAVFQLWGLRVGEAGGTGSHCVLFQQVLGCIFT